MIPIRLANLIPPLVSFALAAMLTPIVRVVARRLGFVAEPKTDRWHKKPTAMMGGVAMWMAVIATYLAFVPHTGQGWVVVGAASFLFLVGLADDYLHFKPYQKLIGQVVGAAIVVNYGLVLPWTRSFSANMVITIFWLIGITNAVNLLDNMDGLATGIAAIASGFLTLNFITSNQPIEALMLAVFAGALLGFLVYNSNPASIFMGDSGSMFIGFFLASASLINISGGRSRTLLVLVVPILVLFIPIFDATFVTVLRKLSGRAASQGGRDHTSHRLVALGLSEKRAVLMLYGLAAVSGLLAVFVRQLKPDVSIALLVIFTLGLTLLGVYLAGVKGYDEEEQARAAREKLPYAFLIDFSYKRRIFEVLLDIVLIVLAYWSAYAIKFEPFSDSPAWKLFLRTLPVLVVVRLGAFLVLGVYRGIWRYTSMDDLMTFAKAVFAGSLLSVIILVFKFNFQGFSRAVFLIDALVMLLLLAGSRIAFRFFRQVLPAGANTNKGKRVLIYGAGDAGELLLRELLNNRELRYTPVGFMDDDKNKHGKLIHGFRVFGGNGLLAKIMTEQAVEQVLISTPRISEDRIAEILSECDSRNIELRRMSIRIEAISDNPLKSVGQISANGDL
jgi:UDP-GlcNAc:undecaprenyl-phosphate GlcNAc-1-phosphate transferase